MKFREETVLKLDNGFQEQAEENASDLTIVTPPTNSVTSKQSSKIEDVLKLLKENQLGCDLSLCFFMAALNSYRADRCLRPFPSSYVKDKVKDFTSLRKFCDNIPVVSKLDPKKCSPEFLDLLSWVFFEKCHLVLKEIKLHQIKLPSSINKSLTPNYVFEVQYNDKSEQIWQRRRNGRDIFLAYHGSTIDNFYSILRAGLQQNVSGDRELLFGHGIYLSNELGISAHYAPFGTTWESSAIGNKLSVIAICEIINDVAKVKCKDANNKTRSLNVNSYDEIPEKYFVVTDSDMVRVKYLLVYKKPTQSAVKSFISKNIYWILLSLYVLMLLAISFSTGPTYKKYYLLLKKMISI